MIEVRAAKPGDGAIMFEMIRDMRMNFLKKAFMPECGSGEALDGNLFTDNPGGTARGLMAFVDGKPAGYAIWVLGMSTCHCLRDWEMKNFWVDSKFRNQGVGTAMLDWMKEQAVKENIFSIEFFNMALGAEAIGFFAHLGYKPNEVRLRYNVGCIDVDHRG